MEYQIADVRGQRLSETYKAKILDFWASEKALRPERAAERVHQVLQVIQSPNREIMGICTGEIGFVGQLNHYFYNYRSFIGQAHRSHGLVRHLCISTFDLLNRAYLAGEETRAIGVFMNIENEQLKQITPAVWPTTQFVFVGLTPQGTHLRVRYFDGAQISPTKIPEKILPFGI